MDGDANVPGAGSGNPTQSTPVEKLSKDDILRLISNNSGRISYRERGDSKSEVWKKFKVIEVDGKAVHFVKCNTCHSSNSIHRWQSETGTSALRRHPCGAASSSQSSHPRPPVKNPSAKRIEHRNIRDFTTRIVPPHSLKDLNDQIVIGLSKDLRPLSSVEGEGFLMIAQAFINFGAIHGNQDVTKCISHRTTLKRTNLKAIEGKKKEEIAKLLNTAPSSPRFSCTFDMWSDKYTQRHFLSLSVHYISSEWTKASHTLAVNEFPDVQKTTDNIRKDCFKILAEYFKAEDIQNIMSNSFSVTDGGSNMIKVFPNRFPCFCHRLNLAMHWTFNETPAPDDVKVQEMERRGTPINPKRLFELKQQCPIISGTLKALKSLVVYFKQSCLNSKLDHSLKQDVQTRWNSELIMLKSYSKTSKQVKAVLLEKNQLTRLTNIDDDIVNELVEFLTPFKECSDVLSGDKYPTFNLIALWRHTLRAHLKDKDSDSFEMTLLRQQAVRCFEEYYEIDDFYYAACMLHPKYRKLKFADEETKTRARDKLQALISSEKEFVFSGAGDQVMMDPGNVGITITALSEDEALSKRPRFATMEDSDEECQDEGSELQQYLSLRLPKAGAEGTPFNLLQFWSGATQYPVLRSVAMWVLGIPASQASDERVFSSAGGTMTVRRTQLNGSTLSSLIYLHKNC